MFVGAILLLAWGAGVSLGSADNEASATAAGWAMAAVILSAAALGRADTVHVFFSGLGAFLGAAAVLAWATDRPVRSYVAVWGALSLIALAVFQGIGYGPDVLARGVRAGTLSEEWAEAIGSGLLDPAAETRYQEARAYELDPEEVLDVVGKGSVAALDTLPVEVGVALAEEGVLAPTYVWPQFAVTGDLVEHLLEGYDEADYLLARSVAYESVLRGAASELPDDVVDASMLERERIGSRRYYGWLMLIPVDLPGRNASLDPIAAVGTVLAHEWRVEAEVGSYVLLVRE
jgi:hypothetical protein